MTDIVEKLRQLALDRNGGDTKGVEHRSEWKAADEIERLRAEVERLREALNPFAAMADELDRVRQEYQPPYDDPENWSKSCEWGDLVRARAALKETGNG